MKKGKIRALISVLVVLAILNIILLFLFPEVLVTLLGKEKTGAERETADTGSGQASLILEAEEREYDGNGIFDPLQGVTAQDNDGSDVKHKVGIAYLSGDTIRQKTILYTLYDSKGEKLEVSCKISLINYEGPDITCGKVESVDWEMLPNLAETLVQEGKLHGDDGFGNDASGSIASSYEINEQTHLAEVTFSISNQFNDTKVLKMEVPVENMPVEWE